MLLPQLLLCYPALPGFLPNPISSLITGVTGKVAGSEFTRELVSVSLGIYRARLPGIEAQLYHGPVT